MTKQKVTVITAKKVRTLDPGRPVVEDVFWLFPHGMGRDDDAAGSNPVTWTSKYGSIFPGMYGDVSVDGMSDPDKPNISSTMYRMYEKPSKLPVSGQLDLAGAFPAQFTPESLINSWRNERRIFFVTSNIDEKSRPRSCQTPKSLPQSPIDLFLKKLYN